MWRSSEVPRVGNIIAPAHLVMLSRADVNATAESKHPYSFQNRGGYRDSSTKSRAQNDKGFEPE